MKSILVILSIFTIFTTSSLARIGETLEECIERYGKAEKQEDGSYFFRRSGFIINAFLHENRVDKIRYQKRSSSGFTNEAISQEGIEKLLEMNSGEGKEWRLTSRLFGSRWESEGGVLKARYKSVGDILTIYTADHEVREKARKLEDEKNRLDGL